MVAGAGFELATCSFGAGSHRGQCVYWDEALESIGTRLHPSGRRVPLPGCQCRTLPVPGGGARLC